MNSLNQQVLHSDRAVAPHDLVPLEFGEDDLQLLGVEGRGGGAEEVVVVPEWLADLRKPVYLKVLALDP